MFSIVTNDDDDDKAMRHMTSVRRALDQGDTPIFTGKQPTLSLRHLLSNVDSQMDHQCRITNMSDDPC
jgi:hypothetical protein